MVTPTRLTLARRRRGLTLAELSDRAGVSLQSLSNHETGRTGPRPATVRRIADALGFPEGFFSGPEIDELPAEGISWRARTKTPSCVLDSARAAGTLAAQLYDWIDERFRLPEPDLPSLGKPDPETAPEMVRTRWGPGHAPAPNMVHLLETHGVRVLSLPPDSLEADAFAVWRGRVPFVFLARVRSSRAKDYVRDFSTALALWRREPSVRDFFDRAHTELGIAS
ncbi:hypothetical protein CQW39_36140 [Streptomyces griseofuscus]|nr:helix-turn-helix transcriptional regulator [Streptomyces griseofuscus]RRQ68913.1 hypothetical protein CQW39_36140 [Streptomyces griseofuscus]